MKYKVRIAWQEVVDHVEDVVVDAAPDPEMEIEDVLWDGINDMDGIPPDFHIVEWESVNAGHG